MRGTTKPRPHPFFDIVAIAASAGGLNALTQILSALPKNFPAALVVVQHLDPHSRSLMAEILDRRSELEVRQAQEKDVPAAGIVFIAPPDHHMLIAPSGALTLTQTELVHFLRPSADLLFESVAAKFKRRAIAAVLTGTGTDGSMGVTAIKKTGGVVIAQDPAGAEFSGMPGAAIGTGCVDHVLRLGGIAEALARLVTKGKLP